jgi:hypothetical protein
MNFLINIRFTTEGKILEESYVVESISANSQVNLEVLLDFQVIKITARSLTFEILSNVWAHHEKHEGRNGIG